MDRAVIARRLAAAGVIAAFAGIPYGMAQNSVLGGATAVPLAPPVATVPAQPMAPPQVQTPYTPPPPGLVQSPLPPASSDRADTGAADGGAPPAERNPSPAPDNAGAAGEPAVMPVPPNTWLSQHNAILGMLDKEDGAVSQVTVPVGSEFTRGKLRIKVLACISRPPAMPPDSAIFLLVRNLDPQDQNSQDQGRADQAKQPVFQGWLLHSEPGASVVDDATNTFRVIGCD